MKVARKVAPKWPGVSYWATYYPKGVKRYHLYLHALFVKERSGPPHRKKRSGPLSFWPLLFPFSGRGHFHFRRATSGPLNLGQEVK